MSRGRAQSAEKSDWARTPSAMFAAGVLGLASLGTLGVAVSRDLQRLSQSPAMLLTQSQIPPDSPNSDIQPRMQANAVRLIDVNNADLSELDLLPGIGPALGQRIIDYRTEHGSFESKDDLQRVGGIGPRTLDRLRPLVTLGEGGYTSDN